MPKSGTMTTLECPVLKNVASGEIIEISQSPFTIGRSLASDCVIGGNAISRVHCTLFKNNEGWVLRDSSTNGTMVNGDIYNSTTSCILKNNDEICVGSYSHAYKFLASNPLKSEGSATPDGVSGNSPASSISFDDNGVSDDVLNNLTDNILSNIGEAPEQAGSNANVELSPKETSQSYEISNNSIQNIVNSLMGSVSATNQSNEPHYEFNNIIDPVQLMLQPAQFCANANLAGPSGETVLKHGTNLEEIVQENNSEKSILRDLLYENSDSNGVMIAYQEELPSSGSTIIYDLPEGTHFNLHTTEVDQNAAELSTNNNYMPVNVEANSKTVPSAVHDSVEQFKTHFDQTLDQVIRKYTVPAEASSTATNSTAIVSPTNVNKKVIVASAATTHSCEQPTTSTTKINCGQTRSINRVVSRPVSYSEYFSRTQPPQSTSRVNMVPEQVDRVVPRTTLNFDVVIDLTNSQMFSASTATNAPSTSVSAVFGVPISSTATGSVPANNLPVVSTSETSTSGGDVAAPSSNLHNLQEPSTSKQPDKGVSNQLQFITQNIQEMEDELTCTICVSLFMKPVTLGCSHSFCEYCIGTWREKRSDCPICRKPITSCIRTLVLDNVIEKILETAPPEEIKQRNEVIEERKKAQEARLAAQVKEQNNRRARRGRRNAATRSNNNVRAAPQPPPQPPPQPIQIIDSGDSSTSSDSELNDDILEDYHNDLWYTEQTPYYGGYGRCYICGNRGHWANGCPFR